MDHLNQQISQFDRRGFIVGATTAAGAIALSGCATMGGLSFVDVIRRLLERSTSGAFARLTAPGGFWDNQLARLALPSLLGSRGGVLEGILSSGVFKDRLQRRFNTIAEDGARRAAPMVAETVRTIGIDNAVALIKGGPTAATGFLRQAMNGSLIEAMVPALGDAMRVAGDPVIGQALGALTGVDVASVSRSFAVDVDNAIWGEIGREETAIRANPESTNDPLLIAAFKAL